jgi:hypothetical protein
MRRRQRQHNATDSQNARLMRITSPPARTLLRDVCRWRGGLQPLLAVRHHTETLKINSRGDAPGSAYRMFESRRRHVVTFANHR